MLPGALAFVLVPRPAPAGPLDVDRRIEQIWQKHLVRVHYRYDPEVFFPPARRAAPYNAYCKEASSQQVDDALAGIERFLNTYRPQVIRKHLDRIFFCSKLEFHGRPYAGTYIGKNLYIDNDEPHFHLHHEFASVLMHRLKFPWKRWRRLRQGQVGPGSHLWVSDDVYPYLQTYALLESGFYIAYAASNLENDFNVVVSYYMTERAKLRRTARKYPKLRAKYRIVDSFYRPLLKRHR